MANPVEIIFTGKDQGLTTTAKGAAAALGDVREGAAGASQGLQQAEQQASETNAKLEAMAKSISLQQRELNLLEKELQALTSAEKQNEDAIERKRIAIERLSQSIQDNITRERAATAAAKERAAAARAADMASLTPTKEMSGSVNDLTGDLKNLAGAYIGVGLAQTGLDWAREGAAIEGVEDSFERLAAGAGKTSKVLLTELRAASMGMIADAALMQGANTAILLGGERLAAALPQILQIAAASAKATGQDIQYVFESLVTGLARGSVEIIDNAGIAVNAEQVYKDYAASLGKTAEALTDVEKKQAFQNAVLSKGAEFVDKIGVSSESSAAKIAQAEAAWDNLMAKAKGAVADFVVAEIEGIEMSAVALKGFADGMDEINQKALNGRNTYADYIAALRAVGEEGRAMSQAQFDAGVAMVKNGTSAQTAAASVQHLADVEGNIAHAFRYSADTMGINEQAQAALMAQAMELASGSEYLHSKVFELAEQFSYTGDLEAFRAGLDELTAAEAENAGQVEWLTNMLDFAKEKQIELSEVTAAGTVVTYEDAYALAMKEDATIAASIAKQQLALDEQMTREAASAAIGTYAAQEGSLYAMAAAARKAGDDLAYMAMMAAQAQLSRSTVADRAELKMMGIDPRDQRAYTSAVTQRAQDIVNPAGAAARQRDAELHAREVSRQIQAANREIEEAKRGGGRSRGGGGSAAANREEAEAKKAVKVRESMAKDLRQIDDKMERAREQFADKMVDLEQKHTAKVQKIWDDFYAKQKAAVDQFNSEKFDNELGFRESLKNMDASQRAEMIRQERQAWEESQQLAQNGSEEIANEYYQMRLQQIKADQERAAEMAELERQITEEHDLELKKRLEAELEYQRRLDADIDQRDRDKLEQLKKQGQELETERDAQLAKENEDYGKARQELVDQYGKQIGEIGAKSDELVRKYASFADAIIAEIDRMHAAASAPIPSAGAAGGSAAPGAAPTPEAVYAVGTDRVPRDQVALVHQDEVIIPAGREADAYRTYKRTGRADALPSLPGRRSASGPPAAPTAAAPAPAARGQRSDLGELALTQNFYGKTEPRQALKEGRDILRLARQKGKK